MAMSPLNPFNRFRFFYREIANPRMNGKTANLPGFQRLGLAATCKLHSKWVSAISYNARTVKQAKLGGWQAHGMRETLLLQTPSCTQLGLSLCPYCKSF
jgi:hypothetical protein